MRCREAQRWGLAEAEGRLAADRGRALRAHLACCPRCAERARLDGWIERDLAALRELPDFSIDVSARIRSSLASLGAPLHDRPTPRQLSWSGLAAAALAALALAELFDVLHRGSGAPAQLRLLARATGSVALALARSLLSLTQAAIDATAAVLQTLFAAAVSGGAIETAGWTILAGWLVVLSTTGLCVGRDLVRGRRLDRREEI